MATKSIRIGSLEDINQYDDADFPISIQVDGPISIGPAGAPTNPNEAVRLADVATPGTAISSGAVIADHAIVRGDGGGRAVQDSGLILDDSDNLTKAGDLELDCGANNTWKLVQTVYDDWYFEIAPKTTGAGKPSLANFSGNINQYQMAVNDISELRPVELAHKWKEATQIELHVHWATNGLDGTNRGVKWEIDYTWANMLAAGGTTAFAAATTVSVETQIPANTPDKTNMFTSVTSFTPVGGKIGANLLMSLKRIASVTDPAPSNDPWIFMAGVHYQIDTMGSRQITTK